MTEPLLKCEMCGKQDETVQDYGYKLCPSCNKQLGKSIDALEEWRAENPEEYDGGGGA